jgi:hypothetical protein
MRGGAACCGDGVATEGLCESCAPQFSQKADPAILACWHTGQINSPVSAEGTIKVGGMGAFGADGVTVRRS